jgi:hypothetical protein
MPSPRIFISSTCYDLKYIRENLKFFIRNLGYEPVLSEEGNIFYDPSLHVHDACLAEVPTCQILVLIIGGSYGGRYKDSDKSITNREYLEAVKMKIPIFAIVERGVYEQFHVYNYNKGNRSIDASKISYPSADSPKIFEFINQVQSQTVNNALVPFSDFEDIQGYLKQQWAGLMYRFLTSESESRRVADLFTSISNATDKIEFLTRQVVSSVADPVTKLNVEFYDYLLDQQVVHDLSGWQLKPSPSEILKHATFDEFCDGKISFEAEEGSSMTYGGPPYRISRPRYLENKKAYKRIREEFIKRLAAENIPLHDFIEKNKTVEVETNASLSSKAASAT